ncbi:MAG TPA: adenylyl-sulfate kinase [Methylophilus sp.]
MTNKVETLTSTKVVWFSGLVSPQERAALLKQQPKTIWFTGLSGSGKSTLAYALERRLIDMGHACYVLDGDNVRHGLNNDLNFSSKDRAENVRRVAEVSKLMNDAGLIVITSFISPSKLDRAVARDIVGENNFFEIHMSTPISVCEKRDPKGMYLKARAGQIADFTGVSSPYEVPESPFLSIDSSNNSTSKSVDLLVNSLRF